MIASGGPDRRVGLLLDPVFERHDTGAGHPERPERIAAVRRALEDSGLAARCVRIPPREATREELSSLHTPEYLDRLETACRTGRPWIDTTDSMIGPESCRVARLAAGGALDTLDRVATGELEAGFCAVRPPGHHAEADRSMGFCLYNNVALAARRLLDKHALERVAVLDWDAHHGNGTQHLFEESDRVFYISLHQDPRTHYPGSGYESERGRGLGEGFTLNVPLAPGSGDSEFTTALQERVIPALGGYAPEFLLVSAGFDAHAADPLSALEMSSAGYRRVIALTLELARSLCGGRCVALLEGGYDLEALTEGVSGFVEALLNKSVGTIN